MQLALHSEIASGGAVGCVKAVWGQAQNDVYSQHGDCHNYRCHFHHDQCIQQLQVNEIRLLSRLFALDEMQISQMSVY